jgi:molybdate transport system substrate-binding protein
MKSGFIFALCLVMVLVFSACTPQATPMPTATSAPSAIPTATATPEPTATATSVPTATATQPPAITLNVFAASSLTAAYGEIGKAFQAKYPWVTVTFNFAGSQALATQINNAAPADVFASANNTQMGVVTKAGRIDAAAPKPFVKNRLVVVFPKANPANIQTLQDLAKPGLKLVLADKTVPVGQYALAFLDNAVKDASFGANYKTDVLKNVVSYELDVKSVLSKVELGEADAGIVYNTDAATDTKGLTGQLAIPDALNVIAVYPIAVIKDSKNLDMAQAFVDYVLSADGQATMVKYGFIPVK